jgi:hypothetical protein
LFCSSLPNHCKQQIRRKNFQENLKQFKPFRSRDSSILGANKEEIKIRHNSLLSTGRNFPAVVSRSTLITRSTHLVKERINTDRNERMIRSTMAKEFKKVRSGSSFAGSNTMLATSGRKTGWSTFRDSRQIYKSGGAGESSCIISDRQYQSQLPEIEGSHLSLNGSNPEGNHA